MRETYLTDIQLAARYGVHRATPWRWAKVYPDFPKAVRLSPQCSRWKLSEIEAWEANRVTGIA
jgi:prophage regulatory protein